MFLQIFLFFYSGYFLSVEIFPNDIAASITFVLMTKQSPNHPAQLSFYFFSFFFFFLRGEPVLASADER